MKVSLENVMFSGLLISIGCLAGALMGDSEGTADTNKKWQDELVSRGLAEWKLEVGREVTSSFSWLPKPEPTVRFIEVPLQCNRIHIGELSPTMPFDGGSLLHVQTNYVTTNYWLRSTTNDVIYLTH